MIGLRPSSTISPRPCGHGGVREIRFHRPALNYNGYSTCIPIPKAGAPGCIDAVRRSRSATKPAVENPPCNSNSKRCRKDA